jgi:hypothetical protein
MKNEKLTTTAEEETASPSSAEGFKSNSKGKIRIA